MKGVIIDFSSLTSLDPSGVVFLRQLQTDLEKLGVALYIAGCSGIYSHNKLTWKLYFICL